MLNNMLWGYQIWLEMWLGGMAGGAFLAAFLYELFSGQKNKQLLRPATFIGIPLVIIALILSLLDLGEPFRFWHMLVSIKPLSPIWIGAFLLQPFVGLSVIMAILYIVDVRKGEQGSKGIRAFIDFLSWINAIIAAVLIAYSGVMLTASNISLWADTPLMPSLFVASAAATGVAILIFSASPQNLLWGGEMLIGVILPIILLSMRSVRESRKGVLIGALLVVLGLILNRFNASMFALAMRPGYAYTPHWMEFGISAGIVSWGLLLIWLANKYLAIVGHAEPVQETGELITETVSH
ncbi:MAG: NrfD/PsrC family molybdoenzyme membrane anchor subunit [Dehalococcoidales bacterium]|nr:NrfD/PsrC family molybdoenzyme membrane anchor subunit [Dehalococcoidales bacterium]